MVDLYYMLPSGASYKSEACVKNFEQRILNDFIEDQAFSPSYDLASPPSPAGKLDCIHTGRTRKRDNFLRGEEGVGGRGRR